MILSITVGQLSEVGMGTGPGRADNPHFRARLHFKGSRLVNGVLVCGFGMAVESSTSLLRYHRPILCNEVMTTYTTFQLPVVLRDPDPWIV